MLKLQNVCKTYKTKAKAETQALKNVNLELSSRGMVFVLGKSGSGKSTLLNLLGGLDSPTSGEIFVDGKSMTSFTPSDYADYRNDYVGFIFQEFNLLADFNVKDNVALALQLTKSENIADKVSDALRRVELNDDYLNRRIDEMSGGEKQRIAIARALIKQSKMILADEPTGNLDSQTGESIWNILKSLSAERLVVVVSHDRESAEKYADRIIEIADGEIISDTGSQPSEAADIQPSDISQPASAPTQASQPSSKVKRKSRLSFATCFKMGFNNLRLRKAKTISVILVAVFCILSIVFTQMALSFSPEASLAKYMQQNDVEYFTVTQGEGYDIGMWSWRKIENAEAKQYIAENCQYIDEIVESKQDILDMGLSFVGEALELDDYSFYISSIVLEELYAGYREVEIDGRTVELNKSVYPVEALIGKKVNLEGGKAKVRVFAGAIDFSDYVDEFDGTSWEDYPFPRYFYNGNFDGDLYNRSRMLIRTSSVKNLSKFVRTLRRDYNCGIQCAGIVATTDWYARGYFVEMARVAYGFEEMMQFISFILLILGAILLIILILLVVNLVSFSITNRKREIGILSAIGASNKDITGIFLLEIGIIAALVFVLGFIASFVIAHVTNTVESKSFMLNMVFPFMRVDIWTVVTLLAASFGLLLLAALIPLRRVIKQKPVDAIRHI